MARIAGFDAEELTREFSSLIETGVREGRIKEAEAVQLLEDYRARAKETTYLGTMTNGH